MKLKKIAQVVFLSCGFLALAACSTTGKGKYGNGMSEGAQDGSASASGLGENEGFGGRVGPHSSEASRTYYFAFDNSEVAAKYRPAILANADYLISHPRAHIDLNGYTDPRGSREYNVALGERRANAVFSLLKSRGVNPAQVHVVSYGAEQLASSGHTEADYQLDRRVVIVYTSN